MRRLAFALLTSIVFGCLAKILPSQTNRRLPTTIEMSPSEVWNALSFLGATRWTLFFSALAPRVPAESWCPCFSRRCHAERWDSSSAELAPLARSPSEWSNSVWPRFEPDDGRRRRSGGDTVPARAANVFANAGGSGLVPAQRAP